MKTKLTFQAYFSKTSTHWVSVVVHTTARAMRCAFVKLDFHNSKDAATVAACCWQAHRPGKDGCLAEIHLAADILTLDHIAHEATHAAYWRTKLVGLKLDDDRFEEWVADDTGNLTDVILAYLDSKGVRVRYASAPKRTATKRYVKGRL